MPHILSQYVVTSNRPYRDPEGTEWWLLYATRTGQVVPVTREVRDALKENHLDALSDDIRAGLSEVEILVPESDELLQILDRQRKAAADMSHRRFALLPTSYCNMGCSYCGQSHTRGRLSANHRDSVIRRVTRGLMHPTTRSARVAWFGAEPMVGYPLIREMSRIFIETATEHNVDYWSHIVTNGSLLTLERARVLHTDCRVVHAEITLDGPEKVHDEHRPMKSGKGSFRHIVRTLQRIIQEPELRGLRIGLRTNVDRHNAPYISDYLRYMSDAGFGVDQVFFDIHSVHTWGNDVSDVRIQKDAYSKQEAEWMNLMIDLGLRFETLPGEPVGIVCSAVTRSAEMISSTGNIFSCSEYPLVEEAERNLPLAQIESFPPGEARPSGPFDDWHDSVERGETPCRGCTFLPICGGSCPKQWRDGETACPSYKYNHQDRLAATAKLNGFTPA